MNAHVHPKPANKLDTYEAWLRQVNNILLGKVGLTADDMPDCCTMDWFQDGVSPKEAARRIIREAKDY